MIRSLRKVRSQLWLIISLINGEEILLLKKLSDISKIQRIITLNVQIIMNSDTMLWFLQETSTFSILMRLDFLSMKEAPTTRWSEIVFGKSFQMLCLKLGLNGETQRWLETQWETLSKWCISLKDSKKLLLNLLIILSMIIHSVRSISKTHETIFKLYEINQISNFMNLLTEKSKNILKTK